MTRPQNIHTVKISSYTVFYINQQSSKKPTETRQRELHDAISPSLVELTAGSVNDWIRDKQLSQLLIAVVQHCSDNVTTITGECCDPTGAII